MLVLLIAVATGAWADTTVTWNSTFCYDVQADYEGHENNSDGGITVTFTSSKEDGGMKFGELFLYDERDKLTFTSTVGNIKKIEVYYTSNVGYKTPVGWTDDTDNEKFVWEGTPADAVEMQGDDMDIVDIYVDHIVFTVEPAGPAIVNLGTLTGAYEAQDGDVLTGTLNGDYQITVAAGATITLRDADITCLSSSMEFPGITPLGDLTIILEGTNKVKGSHARTPGIYVPENCTLTIDGTGSLEVSSGGSCCAIGSKRVLTNGMGIPGGNIVINGGTITANGGNGGAGIGGCAGNNVVGNIIGNITINGGNITASGLDNAPGIGSGFNSQCGDITINGGTVTATGHGGAAGIGCGKEGRCGNITIAETVTQVTAIKGSSAPNSIGQGSALQTCGTITIGGVVKGNISESPYYYPAPTAVASIGETNYATLGAAFDAAETGQTIKLLSDVTQADGVGKSDGKTVTFDLNGHIYTCTDDYGAMAVYNSQITIIDSSTGTPGGIKSESALVGQGNGKIIIKAGRYNIGDLTAEVLLEHFPVWGVEMYSGYTLQDITPADAQGFCVSVVAATYKATFATGSGGDGWTITPAEATTDGVPKTTTVTVGYTGTHRVKSVKVKSAVPGPFDNVTAADLGKVIGADGNIYDDAAAATAANTTAVAVICYVGEAGTADASSATYKGLALALTDASTSAKWSTSTYEDPTCLTSQKTDETAAKTDMAGIANTDALVGHSHTHDAASAARNYNSGTHPTGTSEWFLPSAGQWEKMISFYGITNLTTTANGYTGLNTYYWSSTECSNVKAWDCNFGSSGSWANSDKNYEDHVRACLAF